MYNTPRTHLIEWCSHKNSLDYFTQSKHPNSFSEDFDQANTEYI